MDGLPVVVGVYSGIEDKERGIDAGHFDQLVYSDDGGSTTSCLFDQNNSALMTALDEFLVDLHQKSQSNVDADLRRDLNNRRRELVLSQQKRARTEKKQEEKVRAKQAENSSGQQQ